MQTLTISRTGGRSNYTLSPTRNTGELQDKLAKCNGKSRRLPLRDLRTKAGFPVFTPGMSTAEYVKAYSSGDGTQLKAWEWAQLNDAPCTLYSGADTCETLPDGFETWEDFDAAQSDDAAPESTLAAANDDAAPASPTATHSALVAEINAMSPVDAFDYLADYTTARERHMTDAGKAPDAMRAAVLADVERTGEAVFWARRRGEPDDDGPTASPPATHSAADDGGFAHRVATAAAFISSGRNPTRAFSNCLEMYDGAAVAVALMRRAEKRPDSKMAANIWRYLCRAATESSAAEQPADMSLAEWSIVLIQRAQSESNAMRADPLPSESETDPLPADSQDAPDVAKWRAELRSVEDAILRAAPARYSNGRHGCDIEAAARSRSVPADLKRQRKYLRASLQGARMMADAVQPAPVASAPPPVESRPLTPAAERTFATDEADERASVRPWPDPLPVESAPLPGKSEPETLMLSHVLGALQCIAPDGIPDAAMLAREADRIEATAERMRDAMPDYSATCATAARDLRALADSTSDPLPGKSEPAADPFDAWQAAPNDQKPTFGAYSYAKRTGRTVVAYCGGGRIQLCAKAAGMRYVHRANGFVGTPKQAGKMRAAWLAGAMRNAERAKAVVAEPGTLRAMLESLAVPAHTPLPGKSDPEALDDDETIPAPLDGLDVEELGDDGMAEFERATREQATAPAYRELTTAHYRPQGPCLRIPAFDARAMIPQRFAPVYLLQS